MNNQQSIATHFNNWISLPQAPVDSIPAQPKPIYKSMPATIQGKFAAAHLELPSLVNRVAVRNLVRNLNRESVAVKLEPLKWHRVNCPFCKAEHTAQVLDKFTCNRCGKSWKFDSVTETEAVLSYDGQAKSPYAHLMMIDQSLTTTPVYILEIGDEYWWDNVPRTLQEVQDHRVYYVESHTCPTNILGGINITIGVTLKNGELDTDPHGFLRHVYSVPLDDVLKDVELQHPWDDCWQSNDTEAVINYILKRMKGQK